MTSASHYNLHFFLAGAAVSATLIHIYQKVIQNYQVSSAAATKTTSGTHENTYNYSENKSEYIMDSVSLDRRLIRKAEGAIRNRTSRLVIVVERCTNDHNYSAILRTAEALGVQHVWIISPRCIRSTLIGDFTNHSDTDNTFEDGLTLNDVKESVQQRQSSGQVLKYATESEKLDRALHHIFAQKATDWLTVREFSNTDSCIDALRAEKYTIWVTDLSQVAVCLTADGLKRYLENSKEQHDSNSTKLVPEKVAIVFGTEAVGCSTEMLHAADLRVYLPLRGFADSLNLSVATALIVHQMFSLDPSLIGAMSEEERKNLRRDWYARLAAQRILSSREKKQRTKLISYINACKQIDRKISAGEQIDKDELKKWERMKDKEAELSAIETRISIVSQKIVQDLVENPPEPIHDMRRADEHRICFVGKNTKNKYGELWDNMPATANTPVTHMTTASFFRKLADSNSEEIN